MADLNGINTQNMDAAIRAKIYSGKLREQLEPELIATKYVDVITDFPDGESWEDLELGSATVSNYAEGDTIDYKGLDIGSRLFEINNYVHSSHCITAKFMQDSYISNQIAAKVPALEARAIYADLEQKLLALGNKQTLGNGNKVNGMQHRFVVGDATEGYGALTPEDFAYADVALSKANYHGSRVAIVPSYQTYLLASNPRIRQSLQYNPKFEGIVRDGCMSGMKFAFNIMGFDVYTSEFLPSVGASDVGLKDRDEQDTSSAITDCGAALFFGNITDRRPFRMAWRQMPMFEGEWNKDKQRQEFVTVARYGIDLGDRENLVVGVCKDSPASTLTLA